MSQQFPQQMPSPGYTNPAAIPANAMPASQPDTMRVPLKSQYAPAQTASFSREVLVEFRKMWDTRAARIIGIVAVVLAIAYALGMGTLMGYIFKQRGSGFPAVHFSEMVKETSKPLLTAVAVAAILSITQEFGQRTALTTFILQPKRMRALLAKLCTIVVTALVVGVMAFPLGAVMFGMIKKISPSATITWNIGVGAIIGYLFTCLLTALLALGFSLLTLNTVWALILYFALPFLMTIVAGFAQLNKGFADAVPWFHPHFSQIPLLGDKALTAAQWGQLGVSQILWIAVPIFLGIMLRWMRADVK